VLEGKGEVIIDRLTLLECFSPDPAVALKLYVECTESESWSAKVGFATIIDRAKETEKRLSCVLDSFIADRGLGTYREMVLSGSITAFVRELRDAFIRIAVSDGHALKDVANFLHVSHETVRRKLIAPG